MDNSDGACPLLRLHYFHDGQKPAPPVIVTMGNMASDRTAGHAALGVRYRYFLYTCRKRTAPVPAAKICDLPLLIVINKGTLTNILNLLNHLTLEFAFELLDFKFFGSFDVDEVYIVY